MEVTQVGVRNRARAMAMAAEETEDNSGAVKRRKLGNEKLRSPSPSPSSKFEKTKNIDCEIYITSAPEEDHASASSKAGGVPASCCSSTELVEKLKVADLEESFETETSARYKLNENESTPESEFKAESGENEPCTAQQSPEKMPPEAEIEAFFAAAEEDLNKRFKDKYNYDIVNDIPLKGRYDWVQLTPGK